MTLQDEAEEIFALLIKRHPHNSPWLSFADGETCPKKLAARNFVAAINARIAKRPQLLTCLLDITNHTELDIEAKKAPLFIVLQMWIIKRYSYKDKSYAKQLWFWLQAEAHIVPNTVELSSQQYRYARSIQIMLRTYDILSLEFISIHKLIEAITRQVPDSQAVFAKFAQNVINQHFEEVFWRAQRSERLSTTLQHRQRMAEFINEMRIQSIVDDDTIAVYIDYDVRDYEPGIEYREKAVAYFASQQKLPGYEKLRQSTETLILDRFKATLASGCDLAQIQKIESYVVLYNQRNSNNSAELAKSLVAFIDFYLNSTVVDARIEYNLRYFAIKQAIVAQNQEDVLLTIIRLAPLMKKQVSSDAWYDLFSCGMEALKLPGINKNIVAIELLNPIKEKFSLPDEQIESLKDAMLTDVPNAGNLLFNILFEKTKLEHTATVAPIAKRTRRSFHM